MTLPRNPRPIGPDERRRIGPLRNPARSFAEEMQGVVDDARQIVSDLGLRPYRIFSVLQKWTGAQVGYGDVTVVCEKEFLPTPRLNETYGIAGELRSGGLVERGTVKLDRISASYTEDQVRDLFLLDQGQMANQEAFIEVRVDARDGDEVERRRFIVRGMPFREGEKFQWSAILLRQDSDRSRKGRPAVARLRPPR